MGFSLFVWFGGPLTWCDKRGGGAWVVEGWSLDASVALFWLYLHIV